MIELSDEARCPCGTGETYGACCARLHRGQLCAATAEVLMRSRYCAFALGDTDYLLATWHPRTRPGDLDLDPAQRWLGLEITGRTRGGLLDADGAVTFTAHYRRDGRRGSQQENSRFVREGSNWRYLDGLGREVQ